MMSKDINIKTNYNRKRSNKFKKEMIKEFYVEKKSYDYSWAYNKDGIADSLESRGNVNAANKIRKTSRFLFTQKDYDYEDMGDKIIFFIDNAIKYDQLKKRFVKNFIVNCITKATKSNSNGYRFDLVIYSDGIERYIFNIIPSKSSPYSNALYYILNNFLDGKRKKRNYKKIFNQFKKIYSIVMDEKQEKIRKEVFSFGKKRETVYEKEYNGIRVGSLFSRCFDKDEKLIKFWKKLKKYNFQTCNFFTTPGEMENIVNNMRNTNFENEDRKIFYSMLLLPSIKIDDEFKKEIKKRAMEDEDCRKPMADWHIMYIAEKIDKERVNKYKEKLSKNYDEDLSINYYRTYTYRK